MSNLNWIPSTSRLSGPSSNSWFITVQFLKPKRTKFYYTLGPSFFQKFSGTFLLLSQIFLRSLRVNFLRKFFNQKTAKLVISVLETAWCFYNLPKAIKWLFPAAIAFLFACYIICFWIKIIFQCKWQNRNWNYLKQPSLLRCGSKLEQFVVHRGSIFHEKSCRVLQFYEIAARLQNHQFFEKFVYLRNGKVSIMFTPNCQIFLPTH